MPDQPEIWKRNSSEEITDCRIFKVRADRCRRINDPSEHTFYVIENPDWVNIIAITHDEQVILIEQFRHGTQEIILEIPGGIIDDYEEPEFAAARELIEETGFQARKFISLGKSRPNPAIQNNWIHHFLALDCRKIKEPDFDQHESIVTKLAPLDEIQQLISDEKISHSLVLAAFFKYQLHIKKVICD